MHILQDTGSSNEAQECLRKQLRLLRQDDEVVDGIMRYCVTGVPFIQAAQEALWKALSDWQAQLLLGPTLSLGLDWMPSGDPGFLFPRKALGGMCSGRQRARGASLGKEGDCGYFR